jgi:type II restriction enzyme
MPNTQGILGGDRTCKTFAAKTSKRRELINEALDILSAFGIPMTGTARALERMAEAFLAVADVTKLQGWAKAKSLSDGRSLKTRDIIEYVNRHFGENISRGSYDDVRRRDLLLPVTAKIVVSTAPGSARNAPNRGYALSVEHCALIRKFGKSGWRSDVENFAAKRGRLADALSSARNLERHEVVISADRRLDLGPGEHNLLQKKIVEELLPRFGFGAKVLRAPAC